MLAAFQFSAFWFAVFQTRLHVPFEDDPEDRRIYVAPQKNVAHVY